MKTDTPSTKSIIAFFETQAQCEQAVSKLYDKGFEIDSFSIIAMNLCAVESVKGYYNTYDRIKKWGKIGALYGAFWGLLFGANVFTIPFIGHLIIAGPITVIAITIACAMGVGILSAFGALLFSLNPPKKHQLKYDTEIKAGNYMLLAKGGNATIDKAREILEFHIPKDISIVTEWEAFKDKAQQIITKQSETINLDNL